MSGTTVRTGSLYVYVLQSAALALFCGGAVAGDGPSGDPTVTIDVGDRRQVFIDGRFLERTDLTEKVLESADCVVIVTDHTSYDYPWIVERAPLVVDTRNATRDVAAASGKLFKI